MKLRYTITFDLEADPRDYPIDTDAPALLECAKCEDPEYLVSRLRQAWRTVFIEVEEKKETLV